MRLTEEGRILIKNWEY